MDPVSFCTWNGKFESSVGNENVPVELQHPEWAVATVFYDDGMEAAWFEYLCKPLGNGRYAVLGLEEQSGYTTTMGSEGPVVEDVAPTGTFTKQSGGLDVQAAAAWMAQQ
jgi:hypothetical protein